MCTVRMMVKASVGIVILSYFLNLVPIRETPSRTLHREAIHYKTIKRLKFSVFYCLLILEDLLYLGRPRCAVIVALMVRGILGL